MCSQRGQVRGAEVVAVAVEVGVELHHAALGAKEDILGNGRALDASGRVAEVLAQQLGLGHQGFAEHVAGRETVHGVGHRDQAQRGGAVGDGGQIRGLLRVGAEQDRVARGQQRVDVVVASHHVQGVLAHHARGDLQHEATGLLADGHVVRLHRVEDALAGRGVGDELAAGQ